MSQRIQSLGLSVLHIPDADLRLEPGQQVTVPTLTQTTIGSALRILPPILPLAEADSISARRSSSAVGASGDVVITREGRAWCHG